MDDCDGIMRDESVVVMDDSALKYLEKAKAFLWGGAENPKFSKDKIKSTLLLYNQWYFAIPSQFRAACVSLLISDTCTSAN
ncbi:hypothetical protein VNO77_10477 [Canavalia gladiata]|uniref:Uncharacterized protein n=1 Tax=Canavalia gladiata TaxID=3824 RepID=A0AAN9R231_CANGL